jgi:hypothetical protein
MCCLILLFASNLIYLLTCILYMSCLVWDVTSSHYCILRLFLFYGSVSTNHCLMSQWVQGYVDWVMRCSRGEVVLLDRGRVWGYVWFGYVLLWWLYFITRSNIKLCMSVKVSFICIFCLLKLCMWKRSSVFSNWPFFSMCSISNVWSIVLFLCLWFWIVFWIHNTKQFHNVTTQHHKYTTTKYKE